MRPGPPDTQQPVMARELGDNRALRAWVARGLNAPTQSILPSTATVLRTKIRCIMPPLPCGNAAWNGDTPFVGPALDTGGPYENGANISKQPLRAGQWPTAFFKAIFHRRSRNNASSFCRGMAHKLDGTVLGGLTIRKNVFDIMAMMAFVT